MNNSSPTQYPAANLNAKRIAVLPEHDDDDDAADDDDDDGLSAIRREYVNSLSDFGSPAWWFRS